MSVFLVVLCAIITIAAVVFILVLPGVIPQEAKSTAETFYGLNCAHRGLYTKDQSIPENSTTAFIAAHDKGYGAELDVHLTADNQVVVFHDYDLKRVCGVDRELSDMTYDELRGLRLFDTDERIPLLGEILDILGDTPVIVEIKPAKGQNALLCALTLEILQQHGKNYCIESFDPRVCSWFRKNAPHVLRGQLACPPNDYADTGISTITALVLGNLLFNIISRPHFISYKYQPHPLIVRLCMKMGPMKAIWTMDPEQDITKAETENDFVIFEHYMPQPRFKVS